MQIRRVLACATTALWTGVLACSSGTTSPDPPPEIEGPVGSLPTEPPNILFVLVDDLGWADTTPYGSTFYETPNLDRLAREGMHFTDAYAAAPICSPTRASLLTGKYPARLGITDWIGSQPKEDRSLKSPPNLELLPTEHFTMAEALRDAGYSTFFAGKWHLGFIGSEPTDHGFEHNIAGYWAGAPVGGYFSPYDNPRLQDGPDGEYLTDRLTDETISYIQASHNSNKPFFAYLSYYTVHVPIQPKPELREHFEAKKASLPKSDEPEFVAEGDREDRRVQNDPSYAAMVASMDENIGRLLNKLDELAIADNTIVFVTSDNGGLSTAEGSPTSNAPLRAGKGWLYEGGIREPLFVRAPGYVPAETTSEVPVTSTDFYPTLLEVAGAQLRPEDHPDGESLARILSREKVSLERDAIYWHYPHYSNQGGHPAAAIREGKWKLIEYFEDGALELFDLEHDPEEQNDLVEAEPDQARKLAEKLENWRSQVGAQMPQPW